MRWDCCCLGVVLVRGGRGRRTGRLLLLLFMCRFGGHGFRQRRSIGATAIGIRAARARCQGRAEQDEDDGGEVAGARIAGTWPGSESFLCGPAPSVGQTPGRSQGQTAGCGRHGRRTVGNDAAVTVRGLLLVLLLAGGLVAGCGGENGDARDSGQEVGGEATVVDSAPEPEPQPGPAPDAVDDAATLERWVAAADELCADGLLAARTRCARCSSAWGRRTRTRRRSRSYSRCSRRRRWSRRRWPPRCARFRDRKGERVLIERWLAANDAATTALGRMAESVCRDRAKRRAVHS